MARRALNRRRSPRVDLAGPFSALGYPFIIESDNADLVRYFARIYAALAIDGADKPHVYELSARGVWLDGKGLCGCSGLASQVQQVLWHVNNQASDFNKDRYLLLHASAVACDGRVVVMPAPPNSGKSTLAAGLLRAGFDYLTDELVAIEPETLAVLPYPKPLSIDAGSWDVLRDLQPAVPDGLEDLAEQLSQWQVVPGQIAAQGLPALLLFPTYDPEADGTPMPLRPVEAVVAIAENSFNFVDNGRRWLPVAGELAMQAPAYRLNIDGLDAAALAISGLLL